MLRVWTDVMSKLAHRLQGVLTSFLKARRSAGVPVQATVPAVRLPLITRASLMTSLALLYFFGREDLPVRLGRHVWTVESSRGEVYRKFYCSAQSREWYSPDVLMLAKAEMAYGVHDPATLTYSLMVIPHSSTEIAQARIALYRRQSGRVQEQVELTVSDIVHSLRNYVLSCAYLYYLAYATLAQHVSPDMLYVFTLTFTPWSLLESSVSEIIQMLLSGLPREEVERVLSHRRRHEECKCPLHPLGLVYSYTRVLRAVAEEEELHKQTVEVGGRQVDLRPNLFIMVDGLDNRKSIHVNWCDEGLYKVREEVTRDIKRAKREIVCIAYMDMFKPQTLTLIHLALL